MAPPKDASPAEVADWTSLGNLPDARWDDAVTIVREISAFSGCTPDAICRRLACDLSRGERSAQVDVGGAAFTLDRLFVEVFEISARDGSEINKVIVPVIYGPLIVDGYLGYREHVVQRGDTLSAIAAAHYGNAGLFPRIVRANPTQISDPDLIFPGQILRVPIDS